MEENWLDAGRFKALPAVPEWSDLDRHKPLCRERKKAVIR